MKKNLLFAFVLWLTSSMVQAQNPVAGWTLTTDSVQCLNHNVFFGDDTSVVNGNYNKTWYYGDGDSCHCLHANHSYKWPGRYEIKLVIEQNGFRDSMSHFVRVLASASPYFSMSAYGACRGSVVVFEDTVDERYGAHRIWDFGDGTFDTATKVHKVFQVPGSYAPMLKYVYINGCNDSNNNLNLDIYPAPAAKIFVNAQTQCLFGNQFEFRDISVNDTGVNYIRKWTGTISPAIGDTIQYIFSKEGSAWLKLMYDGSNGCSSSDSISVSVLRDPVVDWTFTPFTFCEGDSFSMSVFGSLPPGNYPYLHYQLYKNDTLIKDDTAAIFRGLTQSGHYLVKSFNGICADSTTSFYVTGIPKLKSTITPSGDTLWASQGYHYQWFLDGQYINNANKNFLVPQTPGNYQVLVTDTFGCGLISDANLIRTGMENLNLFTSIHIYPNPFRHEFQVEVEELDQTTIELYAMDGRCVYRNSFKGKGVFNPGQLSKGIYNIRVLQKDRVFNHHLIKE